MGNAGPSGDFDLSDMDLSLTSLCEGSNNLRESLMDISFPLSNDSMIAAVLAVPVAAAAASAVVAASVLAVASVASAVAVALELVEAAVMSAVAVAEV